MADTAVLPAGAAAASDASEALRAAMTDFVSGVTIVATRDAHGVRRGLTATSFTSVSLHPPLISVCIATSSRSAAAFEMCTAFGVSILSGGQEQLAKRFASSAENKFAGVGCFETIRNAVHVDGSASTLSCTVYHRMVLGDHLLLIGRVVDWSVLESSALAYRRQRFISVDDTLETR